MRWNCFSTSKSTAPAHLQAIAPLRRRLTVRRPRRGSEKLFSMAFVVRRLRRRSSETPRRWRVRVSSKASSRLLAAASLRARRCSTTFFRQSDRPIQPYYISPWQDEGRPAGRVCPSRQDCLNHRLHIERRAVMGSCARSVTFGHHPSLFATPSGLETASCTLFRTFRSPGSYFASEKWRLSDA